MHYGVESYGWFSNLCLDLSCRTRSLLSVVHSSVGGLACGKPEQAFRKEDAVLNSGLLLMAVMGLVSPAMLYYTHTEVNLGQSALALSRFSSCIMLVAYAAFVYFELSNSRRRDEVSEGGGGDQGDDDYDYAYPEISKWEAIAWLAIFTAWISVFSDFLVDAIEVFTSH
ncbi:unnamed protein product [Urochloa humidicola]